MNTTLENKRSHKIALLAVAFWLFMIGSAPAQGVFEAYVGLGNEGSAQLTLGKFYFQVQNDEVEFVAVLYQSSLTAGNLSPRLSVPGATVEFLLGDPVPAVLHGTRTVADYNPFLPQPPWQPYAYDEEGNPIYLTSPVIYYVDSYTGRFALPDGFLDQLLAGDGTVEFSSVISGKIRVVAVPEPAAGGFVVLSFMLFVVIRFNHRRVQRS